MKADMIDEQKYAAAVFFVPFTAGASTVTLQELLMGAGATDIGNGPDVEGDNSGLLDCTWAKMGCLGGLEQTGNYHVLVLLFFRSEMFDLVALESEDGDDLPLEQDGALDGLSGRL